jgi:hypothetical protein
MTTFVLLSAASLALLFFLLFVAVRGNPWAASPATQVQTALRPVDLMAFRNLMDPEEEAYLRENLSVREFKTIQRARLRAAADYVRVLSQNAAILIRLGELARRSEDVVVSQAGQELLDNALRLRVTTLLAQARIFAGIVLPTEHISSSPITDSYERLTGIASRLARLQQVPKVAVTS